MTKPAMRAAAREMRIEGRTYDEIVAALGVSKSSVSLWVRDLPKPPRRGPTRTTAEASAIARRGWEPRLRKREEERRVAKAAAQQQIGCLSQRELLLLGAALYWAEGSKSKPHSPSERVIFVNSDPNVVSVYLDWLDSLGVERSRLRFSVNIHESADVPAAEQFWADHVGVDCAELLKPGIKKHNPRTNRKNVGDGYHGCLRIRVLDSCDLYRRIEGWWYGIVEAANTDRSKCPS